MSTRQPGQQLVRTRTPPAVARTTMLDQRVAATPAITACSPIKSTTSNH